MTNSQAKGLGRLIGFTLVGVGWGGYAIGTALGLTGALALAAGAGIVVGGLIALAAVTVGAIALFKCCKAASTRARNRSRAKAAERARIQSQTVDKRDTKSIAQGLNRGSSNDAIHQLRSGGSRRNQIEYPPEYFQPPIYQSRIFDYQEEPEVQQDVKPSAPVSHYG